MALDLATAKRLIQQRGVQPPPGADYDTWAMQWLEGAVNAGDPAAVQAIGGKAAEEGGGVYADFGGAADPQTWMGQRKPSPRELRKFAQISGQSEDYNRYDDRQLAAWIDKSWDVGGGHFVNDFGDVVEKPTESGAKSNAAGFATGERSAGSRGGGGGGGMGRGGKDTGETYSSPLAEMLMNQGNFLSQYDPTRGDEKAGIRGGIVKGGGIWYQPTPLAPGASMVTGSPGQGGAGAGAAALPGGAINTPNQNLPAGFAPIGGNPTQPGPGGFLGPVQNLPRTTQPTQPPPGMFTNTSALTSMMTPLQSGISTGQTINPGMGQSGPGFSAGSPGMGLPRMGKAPNPLLGTLGRWQKNRPGAWFAL